MFKSLFKPVKNKGKPGEHPATGRQDIDALDEEFQIPSLHRGNIPMTAELVRRREEELLRKRYHLPPSKMGTYL